MNKDAGEQILVSISYIEIGPPMPPFLHIYNELGVILLCLEMIKSSHY